MAFGASGASIQPEIYFDINRDGDKFVVSLGRSESPSFDAIHGCLVQAHAKRFHSLDLRRHTLIVDHAPKQDSSLIVRLASHVSKFGFLIGLSV